VILCGEIELVKIELVKFYGGFEFLSHPPRLCHDFRICEQGNKDESHFEIATTVKEKARDFSIAMDLRMDQ
jgi:hypothetical protein